MSYENRTVSKKDICEHCNEEGYKVSAQSVERILSDAGYLKLPRRTQALRYLTKTGTWVPEPLLPLDFALETPFNLETPVAGVFFFIPYIIYSSILEVVKHCQLPQSSVINAEQAALSILLLNLIGNKRLKPTEDI